MYDVGGKLLNRINNMYIDSQVCVRIKWGYGEWFRIVVGKERGAPCPLGC